MDRYLLSNEGRARFKRMRLSVAAGDPEFEGYSVLAYLYDHGATSAGELAEHTGFSRGKLMDLIITYIHHGLVEGIHEP
jgi:DNA-binding MarR family transcriptional regulator